MKKSYSELLRDPRWQKKRLETLERAGWKCHNCKDTTSTLNVHHKQYRRGAAPWDYPDHDLQVLCETCHELEHAVLDNLKEICAVLSIDQLEQLSGYGEGLVVAAIAAANKGVPNAKFVLFSKPHSLGVIAALGLREIPDRQVSFADLVALHNDPSARLQ